jgi:hypothetical protein
MVVSCFWGSSAPVEGRGSEKAKYEECGGYHMVLVGGGRLRVESTGFFKIHGFTQVDPPRTIPIPKINVPRISRTL